MTVVISLYIPVHKIIVSNYENKIEFLMTERTSVIREIIPNLKKKFWLRNMLSFMITLSLLP